MVRTKKMIINATNPTMV